jgi:hypothetical protein
MGGLHILKNYIRKNKLEKGGCIVIGDSRQDRIAAELSDILFHCVSDLYH